MIKKADLTNIDSLVTLASKLWENSTTNELKKLFISVVNSKSEIIFIVEINEKIIGFSYYSLRNDYVEGTDSTPVGYLEGIYISPEYRKQGYGKELIDKGVSWSKEKGCRQVASDCELVNTNSIEFHKRSGFSEVNRIVCFVKNIK
jgi:aminoglycoside 6'-N-acetyltransferase I